jgi:hypothetical protein
VVFAELCSPADLLGQALNANFLERVEQLPVRDQPVENEIELAHGLGESEHSASSSHAVAIEQRVAETDSREHDSSHTKEQSPELKPRYSPAGRSRVVADEANSANMHKLLPILGDRPSKATRELYEQHMHRITQRSALLSNSPKESMRPAGMLTSQQQQAPAGHEHANTALIAPHEARAHHATRVLEQSQQHAASRMLGGHVPPNTATRGDKNNVPSSTRLDVSAGSRPKAAMFSDVGLSPKKSLSMQELGISKPPLATTPRSSSAKELVALSSSHAPAKTAQNSKATRNSSGAPESAHAGCGTSTATEAGASTRPPLPPSAGDADRKLDSFRSTAQSNNSMAAGNKGAARPQGVSPRHESDNVHVSADAVMGNPVVKKSNGVDVQGDDASVLMDKESSPGVRRYELLSQKLAFLCRSRPMIAVGMQGNGRAFFVGCSYYLLYMVHT